MDLASQLLLGLIVVIYLLPAVVARRRGHPSFSAILVLNIFLGWTFVGWVIALVRSLAAFQGHHPAASNFIGSPADELEHFMKLRSEHKITERELELHRRRIMRR